MASLRRRIADTFSTVPPPDPSSASSEHVGRYETEKRHLSTSESHSSERLSPKKREQSRLGAASSWKNAARSSYERNGDKKVKYNFYVLR